MGLTRVDTSTVSLVTNAAICQSVANATDVLANVTNSGRLVYVVQAGSAGNIRYFAQDPNEGAGDYLPAFVFDKKFNLVTTIAR